LRRLIDVARGEGLRRIIAEILPENRGMQRICTNLGFTLKYEIGAGVVHAWLEL
jgi:acetyltransferase